MSVADFIGCYIPVSSFALKTVLKIMHLLYQILLFTVIIIAYQFKLNGWNPLNWRRRISRELQNPRPQAAVSTPRRGHLALKNPDNLFTMENVRRFFIWVWVWLK
jgi:yeast amino acid transporter